MPQVQRATVCTPTVLLRAASKLAHTVICSFLSVCRVSVSSVHELCQISNYQYEKPEIAVSPHCWPSQRTLARVFFCEIVNYETLTLRPTREGARRKTKTQQDEGASKPRGGRARVAAPRRRDHKTQKRQGSLSGLHKHTAVCAAHRAPRVSPMLELRVAGSADGVATGRGNTLLRGARPRARRPTPASADCHARQS